MVANLSCHSGTKDRPLHKFRDRFVEQVFGMRTFMQRDSGYVAVKMNRAGVGIVVIAANSRPGNTVSPSTVRVPNVYRQGHATLVFVATVANHRSVDID